MRKTAKQRNRHPKPTVHRSTPPTPLYLQFTLRDLPDLGWTTLPQYFHRLQKLLTESLDDIEDWIEGGGPGFFCFPALPKSIVCVNTNYLQIAQSFTDPPPQHLPPLPDNKLRLWLDRRVQPLLLGADDLASLDFCSFFEPPLESLLTWNDEQGQRVVVRVDEIVALEYPGTEENLAAIGVYDDKVPEWVLGGDNDDIPF